jgi:hypothetical protein
MKIFSIESESSTDTLKRRKKRPVKKPAKKFEEYEKTKPIQMNLFEFLEETDVLTSKAEYSDYSRSVELYDFMPKYVWKGQEKLRRQNNGFLPMLEREFECRGRGYSLVIHPAGIKEEKTSEAKYYYPGETEEIVEDVLRKLAVENGGVFLDGQAGLVFTIHQIRQELKEIGHQRSFVEVKRALHILALTKYELISVNENTSKRDKLIFSPIADLGIRGDEDETQTFVVFSKLVTESVKQLSFRLYNYKRVMSYKSLISRQLHKRMAHHFTQASIANKYSINLTTIIRDFGLTPQRSLGKNLQDLQIALEEMKSSKSNVIMDYSFSRTYDAKNKHKLDDVLIEIVPTVEFSREVKKANYLENENRKKLTSFA